MIRSRIYLGTNVPNSSLTIDRKVATDIVGEAFPDGFTLFSAQGIWKGQTEGTMVFEFLLDSLDTSKARTLAVELKDRFGQECVIFTTEHINGEFI